MFDEHRLKPNYEGENDKGRSYHINIWGVTRIKLIKKKSAGSDRIDREIIKPIGENKLYILVKLFNQISGGGQISKAH